MLDLGLGPSASRSRTLRLSVWGSGTLTREGAETLTLEDAGILILEDAGILILEDARTLTLWLRDPESEGSGTLGLEF